MHRARAVIVNAAAAAGGIAGERAVGYVNCPGAEVANATAAPGCSVTTEGAVGYVNCPSAGVVNAAPVGRRVTAKSAVSDVDAAAALVVNTSALGVGDVTVERAVS